MKRPIAIAASLAALASSLARTDARPERELAHVVARLDDPALVHGEPVLGLAFAPSGRALASLARGSVCVWDRKTGSLLGRLRGTFATGQAALAFAPGEDRLACLEPRRVVFLSPGASEPETQAARAAGVAFGHDGAVVTVEGDGVAFVGTDRASVVVKGARGPIAAARTRARVAVATEDGVAVLDDRKLVKTLACRAGALALSPDGATLAVAGEGVALLDVASGETLGRVATVDGPPLVGLAFSPGSATLAVSTPGSLEVVLARSGARLWRAGGPRGGTAPVAFSPEGDVIARADGRGAIQLWDAATGAPATGPCGFTPVDAALAPGNKLVALGANGETRTFDLATGRVLRRATHPAADPRHAPLLADGGTIGASLTATGDVSVWDPETGAVLRTLATGGGAFDGRARVGIAANGSFVAAARGKRAWVFDVPAGKRVHELALERPADHATNVAFAPGGDRVLIGDGGAWAVYGLDDGKRLRRFAPREDRWTASQSVMPSGVVVWLERGEEEARWLVEGEDGPREGGRVHGAARLAVSSDARLLALAETDKDDRATISLTLDPARPRPHTTPRRELRTGPPLGVRFDLQGTRVVVWSADGAIVVVDVAALVGR